MTIGRMRNPILNKPNISWYQKRYHQRIPAIAESKWWIDFYYLKDKRAPAIIAPLTDWAYTNNTGLQTYNASGGFSGANIVFSLVSHPIGLSINSATGVLTANSSVTASGGYTFKVQATNAYGFVEQGLALTVAIAAPITVGSLGTWTETQNTGNKTFNAAVGFAGTGITYSLPTGSTGVSINTSTGLLTADTTTAGVGTHPLVVQATNSSGSATQNISFVVASGLAPPTTVGTIGPWNVSQFTGNQTFNAAAGFTGASITYSLPTGATGVSIDSSTGIVTADTSLTGSGTKSLVVRATNGSGFVNQNLSLVVAALPAPTTVGTIGPWNVTQNTGVQTYSTAGGFTGTSITYSLPTGATGVSINSSTGVVSADTALTGTGLKSLVVRATNPSGSANQPLALTVSGVVYSIGTMTVGSTLKVS